MPVVDGVLVTGCATVSDKASETYPDYQGVDVPMERLDDIYSGNCGFIKIDVEGHQQAVLEGAVETIKRCQPRMLVELEERLSPGGLGRARAFFEPLGYRAVFVWQGQLKPIDRFSVPDHAGPVEPAEPHRGTDRAAEVRPLRLQLHLPATARTGVDRREADAAAALPGQLGRSSAATLSTRCCPMRCQSNRSAQAS